MARIDIATRREKCLKVGVDDLIEGLRRVGVQAGDTIFCHSSLSKFGYVEGDAETVVDALVAAVGRAGTVAAPAGRPSADLGPDPLFDVNNTPSDRGVISEAIRNRSTGRSHHTIDSISAFGPEAEFLTSTHSVTNCGAESPYQKLMATDAQILLLGVSHRSNTTFEAVEEELAPSYVRFKDLPGARIIDEDGHERLLPSKRQDFTSPSDFNKLNGDLIRAGAQSEIVIGEAVVRRVSAARLHQVVKKAIEADPFAVRLREGEQLQPDIPTSIRDLPR